MPYSSGKTSSTSQTMAKISKAPIVACLTCPLCGNLFREATTISECLHTFCKECIHDRFSDDEVNSCPMCNVSLGCSPMEKLRADPQLDDVQAKIFNFVPKKIPPEKLPSSSIPAQAASPVPARRKERSLSSLGVVSLPSSSRARRARQRTWVEEASEDEAEQVDAAEEEQQEKEERRKKKSRSDATDSADDEAGAIYCFETLDSDAKDKAAVGADDEKNGPAATGRRAKRHKSKQLDADFLSPLARLAEIADEDEKKFVAGMDDDIGEAKLSLRATKSVRRSSSATKASGSKNQSAAAVASSSSPPSNGIWFTLAPAASQSSAGEDSPALPQINTPYLRIKDGKLPVSFVKKYLAKKLDLKNETEVEITCLGQPVVSSLPLESVRKIWLAKDLTASHQVLNNDSLGKEFLMVLTYGRNRRTSAPSASPAAPAATPASVTTMTAAT